MAETRRNMWDKARAFQTEHLMHALAALAGGGVTPKVLADFGAAANPFVTGLTGSTRPEGPLRYAPPDVGFWVKRDPLEKDWQETARPEDFYYGESPWGDRGIHHLIEGDPWTEWASIGEEPYKEYPAWLKGELDEEEQERRRAITDAAQLGATLTALEARHLAEREVARSELEEWKEERKKDRAASDRGLDERARSRSESWHRTSFPSSIIGHARFIQSQGQNYVDPNILRDILRSMSGEGGQTGRKTGPASTRRANLVYSKYMEALEKSGGKRASMRRIGSKQRARDIDNRYSDDHGYMAELKAHLDNPAPAPGWSVGFGQFRRPATKIPDWVAYGESRRGAWNK